MLDSKDLEIIRKKTHRFDQRFTLYRWKFYSDAAMRTPSNAHSNHLKKQDRNFACLVALIFLPDLMFYF